MRPSRWSPPAEILRTIPPGSDLAVPPCRRMLSRSTRRGPSAVRDRKNSSSGPRPGWPSASSCASARRTSLLGRRPAGPAARASRSARHPATPGSHGRPTSVSRSGNGAQVGVALLAADTGVWRRSVPTTAAQKQTLLAHALEIAAGMSLPRATPCRSVYMTRTVVVVLRRRRHGRSSRRGSGSRRTAGGRWWRRSRPSRGPPPGGDTSWPSRRPQPPDDLDGRLGMELGAEMAARGGTPAGRSRCGRSRSRRAGR